MKDNAESKRDGLYSSDRMAFSRSIGKIGLTALTVNIIVAGGIFGLPSEVAGQVGRASPIAFILSGLVMAIVMACFVEVASQFSEHGGPYLYIESAFGSYAGLLAGWFTLLMLAGAAAANAALFINYASQFFGWMSGGFFRTLTLFVVIGIAAGVNYIGVRSGTVFSLLLTVAKLLPLLVLIGAGLLRFGAHPQALGFSEITRPGVSHWLNALLMLVFAYAGFESSLIPGGEVENPRRTIPIALFSAFAICVAVYTLLQFVVVATLGISPSTRPLAETGAALLGPISAYMITVAAMIATYGSFSALTLAVPRLMFALAEHGQFPRYFGMAHPRFRTPHRAIVAFALLAILIGATGTFRWALLIATGSTVFVYGGVCAALPRLRHLRPDANAVRLPFGYGFATVGILMSLAVLSGLHLQELLVLGGTLVVATLSWLWLRRDLRGSARSLGAGQ